MANQKNEGRGKYSEFPQTDSSHMRTMMECMSICASCAKKCIEEGNKKTACACMECADTCALAIKAASCQSDFKEQIMDLCSQICTYCADECQKMQSKHCQECASACRECAEACSKAYSMS